MSTPSLNNALEAPVSFLDSLSELKAELDRVAPSQEGAHRTAKKPIPSGPDTDPQSFGKLGYSRAGRIKKIEYPSFDAEAAAPKPEASTIEKQGMDVLDTASELLHSRDKKKELQIQEWNKLPLLKPSVVCYTREEVKNGFRVEDGYTVSFQMSNGNVRVSTERQKPFVDGKFSYFVEKWTEGLAWCYWSNSFRNSKGEDLEYCILNYGMGGWHNKQKDIRAKVIFVNDKRSGDPGDCFVLAMDRPISGCQIRNKQQDENVNVDKVYRSNVPDSLQRIISLRELVNVRDGHKFDSWWYM